MYDMLTPLELESAAKFVKKHEKKHYKPRIQYIIHCSSIGDSIYVQCDLCLKTKDITDYGCW